MSRYVPRIEGLEERQHLDASLPPVAVPPSSALTAGLTIAPAFGTSEGIEDLFADPAGESWQFIERYARKAIKNDELRYGFLPDHDDIVHEVYLEWWEKFGSADSVFTQLLKKDSAERATLRKTVRRVIDHVRYEHNKQKWWVDADGQSSAVNSADSEWRDFRIDVDMGVGGLTAREKTVLLLRGQGKTVDEIGSEIGMAKQRVSEVCQQAITNLRRIYECQELEAAVP